jgi:hypothetical protein
MQSERNSQWVPRTLELSKRLVARSWLIGALAVIVTGAGLLWPGGDGPRVRR